MAQKLTDETEIGVRAIERGSGFDPDEVSGVFIEFEYGGFDVSKALTNQEAERLVDDIQDALDD